MLMSRQTCECRAVKTTQQYLASVLADEVETITATELRAHIGECLTQSSLGKSFCITRKGRVVGYLTLAVQDRVVEQMNKVREQN
jgi:hypothetical protein